MSNELPTKGQVSFDPAWTDCMVNGCTIDGHPHICPGDDRYHHHGAIHTHPRTELDLGPWGWLCQEHFAMAEEEWEQARAVRAGS